MTTPRQPFWQPAKHAARKAEIAVLLLSARLLIRFVPLRRWRSLMGDLGGSRSPHQPTRAQLHRGRTLGAEVERVAERMPFRAVCLPRAMVARWMLARRGIPSTIQIGARRGRTTRSHDLHAWLMLGETCIVGQAEREDYLHFSAGGSERAGAA